MTEAQQWHTRLHDPTPAQETKARAYNTQNLIQWSRTTARSPGHHVTNEYLVQPLRGCKTTNRVRHRSTRNGSLWACSCQHARGGPNTDAAACSHILAVRYYLKETNQ